MYEHPELNDEEEVHIKYTAIPASKQRKWIPWVVLCCGVLFLIIASILTALHFNRSSSGGDPTCDNATAERIPEATKLQLTEERDRQKQLQLMNGSSGGATAALDATIIQLTEERDRLKQQLQNIENHTSEGWLYFRGSLYLGSTSGRSWQQSREFCQERGADLTIITSAEEQEFARLTFPERRWIGLSELQMEGVWKWVDGSLLTTSFWRRGEPNNYNGFDEDCVDINFPSNGSPRSWNDTPCDKKQKCICEKRII